MRCLHCGSSPGSGTVRVRPVTAGHRKLLLEREQDTIDLTEDDIILAQTSGVEPHPLRAPSATIDCRGIGYELRVPGLFRRRWQLRRDGDVVATLLVKTRWPRCEASVGQPMRFHDLRHTHAALLIAADQHPKVIQERLGHGSISTTMDIYGHLFEGLDRAAADALDDLWTNRRVGFSWG